jgi:serine/threonine-protein kinase
MTIVDTLKSSGQSTRKVFMYRKLLTLVFVALLFAGAGFVISTTAPLPERVASHFGAGGHANGYMTRDGYRSFMLFFTVGFPLFIVLAIAGLPRLMPQYTNLPNREYWLAPERRTQAFDFLTTHALWLGCLIEVFICSVHWSVIQANTHHPPQLANGPFLTSLGVFLGTLVVWTIMLMWQFRMPLRGLRRSDIQ